MSEQETALNSELQGTESGTFLYLLHEESVWDEHAYRLFAEKCFAFLECFSESEKRTDHSDILRLLADRLAYISLSVFSHCSGSDLFVISNWSERTEAQLVPAFFDDCRDMISKMF